MSSARHDAIDVALGILAILLCAYIAVGMIANGSGNATADEDGDSADGQNGVASRILAALSSFENVASSHNNPGGLCGSYDQNGNCLGPKTFATLQDGIGAAEALIDKWLAANPLITVEQFVKKWSGGSGQVLDNYVQSVSNALGIDPDDPISDTGDEHDD